MSASPVSSVTEEAPLFVGVRGGSADRTLCQPLHCPKTTLLSSGVDSPGATVIKAPGYQGSQQVGKSERKLASGTSSLSHDNSRFRGM